MRRELTSKLRTVSLAALLLTVPQLAAAQEADVTPLNADIGFIFTTFMFLVSGFLVFFMAAGLPCWKPVWYAVKTSRCS